MPYKIFCRQTGLRVSELALGAGNFGTRWGELKNRSFECSGFNVVR